MDTYQLIMHGGVRSDLIISVTSIISKIKKYPNFVKMNLYRYQKLCTTTIGVGFKTINLFCFRNRRFRLS